MDGDGDAGFVRESFDQGDLQLEEAAPLPAKAKLAESSAPVKAATQVEVSAAKVSVGTQVRVASSLRTGADMLAKQATPLTAYQEGTQVRHPEYGEGVILSVSGRGPKRIARVQFDDGEHRFRLAFVDLELVSP